MIVSISDNSDPARINFRMLRTDLLEKKPDSFCAVSSSGTSGVGDCVADFIPSTSGQSETATLQRRLASSPEAIYQSLKRRKERLSERLRAENKRLLMEREILKKATAFFAKESP